MECYYRQGITFPMWIRKMWSLSGASTLRQRRRLSCKESPNDHAQLWWNLLEPSRSAVRAPLGHMLNWAGAAARAPEKIPLENCCILTPEFERWIRISDTQGIASKKAIVSTIWYPTDGRCTRPDHRQKQSWPAPAWASHREIHKVYFTVESKEQEILK